MRGARPRAPSTLINMSNLIVVLNSQGKYQAAEEIHQQGTRAEVESTGSLASRLAGEDEQPRGAIDSQGKYETTKEMYQQV